jgi:hypothetical protein
MAHDEKYHRFLAEFFDTISVTAFWGILWGKDRVKFRNEFDGICCIRALCGNHGGHG